MSLLKNKKVLLAITGGIAAYKAAYLVRHFIKKGAEVKVILTPMATQFVTPLTLSTLSKNPVEWEFQKEKGEWNNHVEYGLWADLMVIAPMTARTLSSIADGHCNNLVLASYLSAKCPVYVAPAMDLDMYQHPSTQENLAKIKANGNIIIPAEHGELASGLVGEGRMAEPEEIISFIENHLKSKAPLSGKNVLISAGPTYEAIDPVRFLGNHSSGKMGFEIAKKTATLGANVTLISGPSSQNISDYTNVERINVVSAEEMKSALEKYYPQQDIVIMSAAVADYRPKESALEKIKKKSETLTLELVKNPDILKGLGEKKKNQFLVGFALETENEMENAQAKLEKKNLDMIVLNTLKDKGAGFKTNTNKVTFISKDGATQKFDLKPKSEVAQDILNFIVDKLNLNHA